MMMALLTMVSRARAQEKPEFLFLAVDDLSALGVYDLEDLSEQSKAKLCPRLDGKNINDLASEGVTFTRTYTSAPICTLGRR